MYGPSQGDRDQLGEQAQGRADAAHEADLDGVLDDPELVGGVLHQVPVVGTREVAAKHLHRRAQQRQPVEHLHVPRSADRSHRERR